MVDRDERQKLILALVIHEYVEHAQPVGSQSLVENFDIGVSSATDIEILHKR